MMKFSTLIIGYSLSTLIATSAFAAAPPAAEQPATKVAAAAAAPAPPAATPPAKSAPAAPGATAPAPPPLSFFKESSTTIAFIDMSKVAAEASGGKAAAAALKSKSAKLKVKIEAKQKELERQKAAIEAKLEGMSAKERAAKGKEFQKKIEEYQRLVKSSEQEMLQMQDKLTSGLYQEIQKTATDYAKSRGYAAVVEQKAILYLSDNINARDITDEVIKKLDEKKPAK